MADTISLAYRATLTKLDTLTIDATIQETHGSTADVTDHPVEEGSDVSDHKRDKPDTLKIEGLISNTPINRGQITRSLPRSFVDTAAEALSNASRPGYAEAAYTTLRGLKESGKLITVITALRVYENMMLTELSAPRDSKTGDGLAFTASLRSVRLVRNRRVAITTADPTLAKAATKKKTGTKATKTAKEDTKTKSILKKISDTETGDALLKFVGWRK